MREQAPALTHRRTPRRLKGPDLRLAHRLSQFPRSIVARSHVEDDFIDDGQQGAEAGFQRISEAGALRAMLKPQTLMTRRDLDGAGPVHTHRVERSPIRGADASKVRAETPRRDIVVVSIRRIYSSVIVPA